MSATAAPLPGKALSGPAADWKARTRQPMSGTALTMHQRKNQRRAGNGGASAAAPHNQTGDAAPVDRDTVQVLRGDSMQLPYRPRQSYAGCPKPIPQRPASQAIPAPTTIVPRYRHACPPDWTNQPRAERLLPYFSTDSIVSAGMSVKSDSLPIRRSPPPVLPAPLARRMSKKPSDGNWKVAAFEPIPRASAAACCPDR